MRLVDRLNTILADKAHPFRPEFDNGQIVRSGRLNSYAWHGMAAFCCGKNWAVFLAIKIEK